MKKLFLFVPLLTATTGSFAQKIKTKGTAAEAVAPEQRWSAARANA